MPVSTYLLISISLLPVLGALLSLISTEYGKPLIAALSLSAFAFIATYVCKNQVLKKGHLISLLEFLSTRF